MKFINVIVLNNKWSVIGTCEVDKAINAVLNNRAYILDINTYVRYSLDEWQDFSFLNMTNDSKVIRSQHLTLLHPRAIILMKYGAVIFRQLKPSSNNIYIRDNKTCQYCNHQFSKSHLSLDHVIPKSQGGGNTWTNLVTSCKYCNTKKSNRTPDEAGMKLITSPKTPNIYNLHDIDLISQFHFH